MKIKKVDQVNTNTIKVVTMVKKVVEATVDVTIVPSLVINTLNTIGKVVFSIPGVGWDDSIPWWPRNSVRTRPLD